MNVEIMFVEERWVFVLGKKTHSSVQDILDIQVYTPAMYALLSGLRVEI